METGAERMQEPYNVEECCEIVTTGHDTVEHMDSGLTAAVVACKLPVQNKPDKTLLWMRKGLRIRHTYLRNY